MPVARQAVLVRFGRRVYALRTERGLSQEALAERAGLHRTYVGSLERGERNVALMNLQAFASALGLTVAELLRGVDVPTSGATLDEDGAEG